MAPLRQRASSTCSDCLPSLDHHAARSHARLKQLQTAIDILPDDAQVARLELFDLGFDFETKIGTCELECVAIGGRFVPEKHAGLLLDYARAVETSDHAVLAKPVWHFLAKAIGVPVSGGNVFSDIEHFIEHHPKEFEANHQLKAALTSVDTRACRTGIAVMANNLRRRMEAIPLERRVSNQAQALIQAKLLLGSFTDVFHELFENDPVGACSVARTLAHQRHQGANAACKAAILLAAALTISLDHMYSSKIVDDDYPEAAVAPLLRLLSDEVSASLSGLFNHHCLRSRDRNRFIKEYVPTAKKELARAKSSNVFEDELLEELNSLLDKRLEKF